MASQRKRKRSLNSQINEQIRRIQRGYTDIQQRGGVFSQSVEQIINLPPNPNASTLARLKRISKNDLYRMAKTREGQSGWKIRNRRIAEATAKARETRELVDFYQRRIDELYYQSKEYYDAPNLRERYKKQKGRTYKGQRKKYSIEDFAKTVYIQEQAYADETARLNQIEYDEYLESERKFEEESRRAEEQWQQSQLQWRKKQAEADERFEEIYQLYQIFMATKGVIVDPYYDNDERNLNSYYGESNREYALRRGFTYQYDDFYEWLDQYQNAQRMKQLYDSTTYITEEPEESEWEDRTDYDEDAQYSSLEDEEDEAWGYQNFSDDVGDSEAYAEDVLGRLYHELDKAIGDETVDEIRREIEQLEKDLGKEGASQYLQNHEEELMDCIAEVINYMGNVYAQRKSLNRALVLISGGHYAFYNKAVSSARSEGEKGTKLRHLSINTVDENEEYY